MTKKQYRSAMGKTVDMGALLLQNESVRAVGNMGVNARGDVIDGSNRVIDKRSKRVQRQYNKQTNLSKGVAAKSNIAVSKSQQPQEPVEELDTFEDMPVDEPELEVAAEPVAEEEVYRGGLAGALARSRTVQQQLEKTPRQLAKEKPGVRKL